ncbi:hypothetical protein [Wolbachia endosymbiont of Pentidionis agamae]
MLEVIGIVFSVVIIDGVGDAFLSVDDTTVVLLDFLVVEGALVVVI